jgi:hypothetical protein
MSHTDNTNPRAVHLGLEDGATNVKAGVSPVPGRTAFVSSVTHVCPGSDHVLVQEEPGNAAYARGVAHCRRVSSES